MASEWLNGNVHVAGQLREVSIDAATVSSKTHIIKARFTSGLQL